MLRQDVAPEICRFVLGMKLHDVLQHFRVLQDSGLGLLHRTCATCSLAYGAGCICVSVTSSTDLGMLPQCNGICTELEATLT